MTTTVIFLYVLLSFFLLPYFSFSSSLNYSAFCHVTPETLTYLLIDQHTADYKEDDTCVLYVLTNTNLKKALCIGIHPLFTLIPFDVAVL